MQHVREARQGAVHFERLGELEDARHVLAIVGEVVVVQAACTGRDACQRVLTLWAGVQAVRRALQARQGAIQLQHVADGVDAIGGVGAVAILVDPAEYVFGQAER